MEERLAEFIFTEFDGAGDEVAVASVWDGDWEKALGSYWRPGVDAVDGIGSIFRELGETFFFEHPQPGVLGRRLERRLLWFSELGPRRFTFVARKDKPHFRTVDQDAVREPRRPKVCDDRPANFALASKIPDGVVSGKRRPKRKSKKGRRKRYDKMVSALLKLIRETQGHVLSLRPSRSGPFADSDRGPVNFRLPHVDAQLGAYAKTAAAATIGRLEINDLSPFFEVQPTLAGLDRLGINLWDEEHPWSCREEAHALVLVIGCLGPGRHVTWRTREGEMRLVCPDRVARSSNKANTGPFLILLSLVRGSKRGSWRVARAGAVAVVSKTVLVPIDSKYERIAAKVLVKLLADLPAGVTLEKPLPGEELLIDGREILSDFVLRLGVLTLYIEVLGKGDSRYKAKKAADAKALQHIGNALTLNIFAARSVSGGVNAACGEMVTKVRRLFAAPTASTFTETIYAWRAPDECAAQPLA